MIVLELLTIKIDKKKMECLKLQDIYQKNVTPIMSSGIFAVANIGKYRLYVGETHQLKPRWAKMMALLVKGQFPSEKIQQAWSESGKERRFTFHTAQEISTDKNLFNYRQFLKDTTSE